MKYKFRPKHFLILISLIILVFAGRFFYLVFGNPFSRKTPVEPSNDSWKTCRGAIPRFMGPPATSDNSKKNDYWTVRAIKEKNIKLCRNVGVMEGSDVIEPDLHLQAVKSCEYVYRHNSGYVGQCGQIR